MNDELRPYMPAIDIAIVVGKRGGKKKAFGRSFVHEIHAHAFIIIILRIMAGEKAKNTNLIAFPFIALRL